MSSPQPQRESLKQRLGRRSRNALNRSFRFVEKSEFAARAKLIEVKIVNRKKKFGVEYMDLLLNTEKEADEFTLSLCVDQARRDIEELELLLLEHQERASKAASFGTSDKQSKWNMKLQDDSATSMSFDDLDDDSSFMARSLSTNPKLGKDFEIEYFDMSLGPYLSAVLTTEERDEADANGHAEETKQTM